MDIKIILDSQILLLSFFFFYKEEIIETTYPIAGINCKINDNFVIDFKIKANQTVLNILICNNQVDTGSVGGQIEMQ